MALQARKISKTFEKRASVLKTQTARSGDKGTTHEVTAPSHNQLTRLVIKHF